MADVVRRVFERWRESTGRDVRLTDGRRKKIEARLAEGYSEVELLDAVVGWKRSPFHRGENAERKVWNELDLLLRNGEKLEFFRDLERHAYTQPVAAEPEAWDVIRQAAAERSEQPSLGL